MKADIAAEVFSNASSNEKSELSNVARSLVAANLIDGFVTPEALFERPEALAAGMNLSNVVVSQLS